MIEVCLSSFQGTKYDARGLPGWDAVDNLSAYLVGLNRTATALSVHEAEEVVRLYSQLAVMDKSAIKYKKKLRKTVLPGTWRISRKRECSGSAPSQQAAER
jgi:hypothetical protein